jgi:hypothetical protein
MMVVCVAQPQIKQAAASVAAKIRRNFIPKLNSCRAAKLRLKSAFYVTSPATAHLAKLYAMLTAYSTLDVALFTERESAAKWLGVPVEVLMAQR